MNLAASIQRGLRFAARDKLPGLSAVAGAAHQRGEKIWLVGGVVRDAALGKKSSDVDFAVAGDAIGLARQAACDMGATLVPLCDDPPTARLVKDGVEYDLVALRAAGIEEDLRTRDLTLNALALPYSQDGPGELIDPTGGLKDLEDGIVRAVSLENLQADPLRALRVFRFMAQLGFEADPETLSWASRVAPGLRRVAGERILLELGKLLRTQGSARVLAKAAECGIFAAIMPEGSVPPLAGAKDQTPAGLVGLTRHLDLLDRLPTGLPGYPMEVWNAIRNDPVAGDALVMKMAALFYHILPPIAAKPGEGRGNIAIVEAAYRRWKPSRLAQRRISGILEGRDRVAGALAEAKAGEEERRVFAAYANAAGELWLAAALHCAITLGMDEGAGKGETMTGESGFLRDLVRTHRKFIAPIDAAPPLVDGRGLMRALDLAPGPLIGELLGMIRLERMAGEIRTRDEALAFCRNQIERKR